MVSKSNSSARKASASKKGGDGDNNAGIDSFIRDDFDHLCRELNMDTATSESAWKSYIEIRQKFVLEGVQMHWLACALYVACRNSTLPTVGSDGDTYSGNGVSLTRLLRSCKLSLIQFFNKVKKWADMSNLKTEFREKIDHLERNFAVSNVIFKKYQPIFVELFKDPAMDPPKVNRSRKTKKPPCSPGEVFDFCWCLFVRVKAMCPDISDDLVNSYHLLLSCIDHIFACAVIADRIDLINENFNTEDNVVKEEGKLPCVLDKLCRTHDGIISEVKSIREHWWRRRIGDLFDAKVLKGDPQALVDLLEPLYFELNVKAIRKEYEAYVLSIGEYDERVFLGEDALEDIGTPGKATGAAASEISDLNEKMTARRNLASQYDSSSSLMPSTPLSGKHYLKAKEQMNVTPVSKATYLVTRLTKLLGRREPEPSAKLKELFAACDNDPTESIAKRVKELGDIFCKNYTASSNESGSPETFGRMRLRMGVIMYYKNLETILFSEKAKNKPLKNLLEQDLFHLALFACCLEIVIFSYNSHKTFPWILETFELEDIHFYKVVEVIIKAEDWLPREVVKHLQRIEEQILESRAWVSSSPLWIAIEKDAHGVPSCEEVSLPHNANPNVSLSGDLTQSPLSHHGRAFVVKSPMAIDRFKSPVITALARRQLAFDESGAPTIRAGQSLLASPQKPVVQSPTRVLGGIIPPGENITLDTSSDSGKPKRTGSLALFFRKVYTLAHIRLEHLCHYLDVEEDMKRKIWTTFEHVMKSHTDLMKDRHMDQLIMCSLYITCKAEGKKKEKKFLDILEKYRIQPQAASHVYRSVLISGKSDAASATASDESSSSQINPPPTPTRLAASSTVVNGEKRGDLIKFNNDVFSHRLYDYIKDTKAKDPPPLSPLPKLRAHPQSPCRRVSESRSVYIRPLKATPHDEVRFNPHSPHRPLSYSFSRSPAKDLDAINALMRSEVEQRKPGVSKRLLTDDTTSSASGIPQKVQIVLPASRADQKVDILYANRME